MKWIPKILSLIFLWGALASVIWLIEPELIRDVMIPGSYLPFFLLLTMTLWYSLILVVKSGLASLVLTVTMVGGLVLNMMELMHWGLALVLLLTLVMESWYIYHRHEKIHPTNEQKNRSAGL